MLGFLVRRSLQSLLTLALVLLATFVVLRLTGDPAIVLSPPDATPQQVAEVRQSLGLDRPLIVQYGQYVRDMLTGNFGTSFRTRKPVRDEIGERGANTLRLAAFSTVLALLMAVPLGVVAAVRRGTIWESSVRILAVLGISVPSFWLGLVLIEIFGLRLQWLPVAGMESWQAYLMPGLALSVFMMAGVVRLLRSSMLDVLDSEFVKFARIEGLSEGTVIWKHAFRNALIPVVTFAAVYIALFLTGAIVIETVFAWPGLGSLLYSGMQGRDFPVVQAIIVLMVGVTIVVNLLVDVLYSYLDPRVRVG